MIFSRIGKLHTLLVREMYSNSDGHFLTVWSTKSGYKNVPD